MDTHYECNLTLSHINLYISTNTFTLQDDQTFVIVKDFGTKFYSSKQCLLTIFVFIFFKISDAFALSFTIIMT